MFIENYSKIYGGADMKIGKRIRKIRLEKGLKSYELAEKIGVSPSMLSQWENGKEPSGMITIYRIANALEVDIREFIGYSSENIENYKNGIADELSEYVEANNMELFVDFLNDDNLPITKEHPITRPMRIIESFVALNEDGRNKAVERIEELTEIPRYRAKEEK